MNLIQTKRKNLVINMMVQQVLKPTYKFRKNKNTQKPHKPYNILRQTTNIVQKLKNRVILLNQDKESTYTKKQRRIKLIKIMLHYLIRARLFSISWWLR
jgi:hypothetical protein